jgi:hypothetical protein
MARTPQNTKKAKISVYNTSAKKRTGSRSMVVLTPTTTRRGKIIYTEVDAAPYYQSSDEGESPKRKPSNISSHTTTTVPASLEDTFQLESTYIDDQEPHEPRITKVRSRLLYMTKV